jgi:hypothetical protein
MVLSFAAQESRKKELARSPLLTHQTTASSTPIGWSSRPIDGWTGHISPSAVCDDVGFADSRAGDECCEVRRAIYFSWETFPYLVAVGRTLATRVA